MAGCDGDTGDNSGFHNNPAIQTRTPGSQIQLSLKQTQAFSYRFFIREPKTLPIWDPGDVIETESTAKGHGAKIPQAPQKIP